VTGIEGGVRRATLEALGALLRLDVFAPAGQTRRVVDPAREVRRMSSPRAPGSFVGLRGGSVPHSLGRDFVELMAVDPSNRRHGIGRKLLHNAVALTFTPTVFTSTDQSNPAKMGSLEGKKMGNLVENSGE